MQKTIKSFRAILLAIILAVGVFAATTTPVYAAQPQLSWGTGVNGVSNITGTGADLRFNLNLNGATSADMFLAVFTSPGLGASPSAASIINASPGSGGCVNTNYETNSPDVTDGFWAAEGGFPGALLTPATNYIAYLVAVDSSDPDTSNPQPGNVSNILTWTFTILGPPTITSGNNTSVITGTGGSFALTATGNPIWSLDGRQPAGVTISGSTLVIAASVPAGTYTFTITAANGVSPNATQTFTLTVTAGGGGGGGTTGGGGGGAAATTGVSPKTDDATNGNMFLIVMMLLLAAGAVYTGRKAVKAKK